MEAEKILVIKKTWNFIDFQLLRIGEIISLGNVSKGEVKDKENDLGAAFFLLGTILSAPCSLPV